MSAQFKSCIRAPTIPRTLFFALSTDDFNSFLVDFSSEEHNRSSQFRGLLSPSIELYLIAQSELNKMIFLVNKSPQGKLISDEIKHIKLIPLITHRYWNSKYFRPYLTFIYSLYLLSSNFRNWTDIDNSQAAGPFAQKKTKLTSRYECPGEFYPNSANIYSRIVDIQYYYWHIYTTIFE